MNAGAVSSAQKGNGGPKRGLAQSFPSLAALKREREADQEDAGRRWLAEEVEKARSQGYQRGYEDGINAARAEAAKLYESARREGCERGAEEGRKEAARMVDALRGASQELSQTHRNVLPELESFSLEFCLGLLKRLTGANPLRKAFLIKAIKAATVALKPAGVQVVLLNPADMALVEGLLGGLNVKEDPLLEPGGFRVEGGPLFVEGSLSAAMAQVEQTMLKKKPARHAMGSHGEPA